MMVKNIFIWLKVVGFVQDNEVKVKDEGPRKILYMLFYRTDLQPVLNLGFKVHRKFNVFTLNYGLKGQSLKWNIWY